MNKSDFETSLSRRPSWRCALLVVSASLSLAACGGGGGGGGGSNVAPTASFTVAPESGTAPLQVALDASASSDPDGSIAAYSWNFGDGTSGSGVTATHTFSTGATYTVTLTVTDNQGARATATRAVTVAAGPPPSSVTVSGKITYQRVPFKAQPSNGLNYPGIFAAPARGIVVQLIKSSDQGVLSTTNTDASGNYSFSNVPVSTDVKVRARAQSQSTSGATWNVQVKDNTKSDALYVMDSASFNTGVANVTKNLLADAGAGGFSAGGTNVYTSTRVAAPFAILDSIYSAVQFVVTQGDDASIALPALDVFWSPSNQSSNDFVPDAGNIQTTQYLSGDGIYVLGKQNVDTDEYDEHVITHEFQHYLQDATSRDDTVGGAHSLGERLDMRVAFSEGYANAFSGMALGGDPLYRDSSGSKQGFESNFNLETEAFGTAGWYNESTVGGIAWDLWDATPDADDTTALPYATVANVFRNALRTGQPLTSIFPFVVALKTEDPGSVAEINALVDSRGIVAATMDPFGTTETNSGSNGDALPLYTAITPNGGAVRVCGNKDAGLFNKLANRRFLKFSLASPVNATIQAVYTSNGSDPAGSSTIAADPDIVVYKGGRFGATDCGPDVSTNAPTCPVPYVSGEETFRSEFPTGDYVIEVYDYSHIEAPAAPKTSRGRTCYNVTITITG